MDNILTDALGQMIEEAVERGVKKAFAGTPVTPDKKLLSIEQAAERAGCSRREIAYLIAHGELPVIKIGRRTMIDPSDLQDFFMRRKRKGPHGSVFPRSSVGASRNG